jgi:hypothetical protein
MLSLTSTDHAPWYVIPSDRKWYRNLTIASVIVEKLKSLNMTFPAEVPDIDEYRDLLAKMISKEEG